MSAEGVPVGKPEYIKRVVGWILDDTRHAPVLREKAWQGRCLSGVYDGKSAKIRDLVTLAYLRGVYRGASCAWEAKQPVVLRATHPAAASAEREGAWKAMVEALTFYADLDENGNVQRFSDSNYTGDPDDVTYDRGAKARAALAAARATKEV